MRPKLLLFGGSGTIGKSIAGKFQKNDWDISIVSRSPHLNSVNDFRVFMWDPLDLASMPPQELFDHGPYDSVCWSQGQNCNDSIFTFDVDVHRKIYDANVIFIMASLKVLLDKKVLSRGARLCIVSSIWQVIARQNKLSYGVTKSALHGLVLSLANDLGANHQLVNAVLPGALDTPMTRENLTHSQISKIESSTLFNRLCSLDDVANTVYYLCSDKNTGITGQFIKVDLGFSDVKNI